MQNVDEKRFKILRKIQSQQGLACSKNKKDLSHLTTNYLVTWDTSGITIRDGKRINALHGSLLVAAIYHMY